MFPACAIDAEQHGLCWDIGETQQPHHASEFEAIAAGAGFGCGMRTDHTVECWGCSEPDEIDHGQCSVP